MSIVFSAARRASALAVLCLLAACGDDFTPTSGFTTPDFVVTASAARIFVNDTMDVRVTITNKGAPVDSAYFASNVSYSSLNPNILAVTRLGADSLRLIGTSASPGLIRVDIVGQTPLYVVVQVEVDPADVTLSLNQPDTLTLIEGDTVAITLTAEAIGVPVSTSTRDGIAITSTADSIAAIQRPSSGVIRLRAGVFGQATISTGYNGRTAAFVAQVGIDSLDTARFVGAPTSLIVGDSATTTWDVRTLQNRVGKASRYAVTSSDTTIMTVSSTGRMTALRAGVAQLLITAADARFARNGFGAAQNVIISAPR